MEILNVKDLKKTYDGKCVLQGSTFNVESGEFLSILGPSGCGKTTTLRLLIGLETADSGTIKLENEDITHAPAAARQMGIVFQDYALFENMNVLQNVTYPLRFKKDLAGNAEDIAKAALEKIGLAGHMTKRVNELSGGQQQRVSIARTLALNPKIILFDEPMSALDVETRLALRADLKRIQAELGTTMVYITHDQEEAFALSDRIMVMNDGIIHQIGTPEEILKRPASAFVQNFVILNLQKKMNSLEKFIDLVK